MGSDGARNQTKNDCAGEDHQKFTGLDLRQIRMVSVFEYDYGPSR
jgi:hypothetical protein